MDSETQRKIEDAVVDILGKARLDDTTEFKVRAASAERLGIDLSGTEHKAFVRHVVEKFLLSTEALEAEPPSRREEQEARLKREMNEDGERVICKLSSWRNVVIHDYRGKTLVSIREFYKKGGKELPSARGISLPAEQWTNFKNSVPAIEEAIKKMESKLGYQPDRNHTDDGKETDFSKRADENKQIEDGNRTEACKPVEDGKQIVVSKQVEDGRHNEDGNQTECSRQSEGSRQTENIANHLNGASPHKVLSIETCRFNGKNYPVWAQQMEFVLKQLKIAYVLFVSCPVITLAPEASTKEVAQAKAAEQNWMNDDFVCRRSILNALSDDLFSLYSRKSISAKELWEDLKLVHLYEQFGTKRSMVKKYIDYHMLEGRPVLEQIQAFNEIADSIVASGMVVEEKFHVSAIISKLPPSWKDVCIKLMCEEHLPFANLMERLRLEEDLRTGEKHRVPINPVDNPPVIPIPRKMSDMKPRNMQWRRSDPEFDGRVICKYCSKKGHTSQNCRYNKKRFTRDANDENHEGNGSVPMEVNMLEGSV